MFNKIVLAVVIVTILITGNTQATEGSNGEFLSIAEDKQEIKRIQNKTEVIVFTRKNCGVCKQEKSFLNSNQDIKNNFNVKFLDISKKENKEQWNKIIERHKLSKVTPITLVSGDILVGFNEKVTGKKILESVSDTKKYGTSFYLRENKNSQQDSEEYSCNVKSASTCSLEKTNTVNNSDKSKTMILPFFGEVDIKATSLFTMATILGFIDGFNPCAMWVLLTFLIILSQIGDRKKMAYLAGLFILAEGIMYFLILNIWYQTWDFISLDQFVTPLVGVIAIGGGGYFLYKYYKNKDGKLTCEVTSLEHQQKTVAKIKEVISKPITIITTLAVLGIAFSVNIIEFACSVGIAQSFTKILELNELSFMLRQWYILIYSFFYMVDDFLIFGLAIFGYQKFTTVGAKYSHLSSLVGGVLMIILGLLLIIKPDWLG